MMRRIKKLLRRRPKVKEFFKENLRTQLTKIVYFKIIRKVYLKIFNISQCDFMYFKINYDKNSLLGLMFSLILFWDFLKQKRM